MKTVNKPDGSAAATTDAAPPVPPPARPVTVEPAQPLPPNPTRPTEPDPIVQPDPAQPDPVIVQPGPTNPPVDTTPPVIVQPGPAPVVPVEPTPPVIIEPGPGGQPICPTAGDRSIDPKRALQRKTITVYGGRTMIWRKNCEGKVISKTWENVKTPKGFVTIFPVGRRMSGDVFITARSRNGCAEARPRSLNLDRNPKGRIQFSVGLNPGVADLVVGLNQENLIDYEFRTCVSRAAGKCVRSKITEAGTLILKVRLVENKGGCLVYKARGCNPAGADTASDLFLQAFEGGN
ncbi:MAG: hypothetical protein AB7F86_19995 [Bdellovibrionales bacterium]